MGRRWEHYEQVGYWDWMRVFMALSINPTIKVVGCALAFNADYGTGHEAHPGIERLMAQTGLRSDKTVRTALEQLRRAGLIERRFKGSSAGRRGLADMYYLTLHNDLRIAAGVKPCDCDRKAAKPKADPWAN